MSNHDEYFVKYLTFLKQHKLYPTIHTIAGTSSSPEILVNGRKFLTFSSNNYLGLAGDDRIKSTVIDAVKKYGVGSGSTRILSGTLDIQIELENELAEFFEQESAITFSSGYLANTGTIRMLIDPFPYFTLFNESPGIIISDQLNHASIIDGVRLSKAERVIYRHKDMEHLEKILQEYKHRKLILTDGVFSMDGDLAPLREISQLARKYDALIMVDDAHGVGVIGPHGKGTAHHLGMGNEIDVIMGSFTKAFGSIGGFIVTGKNIADYLRITARSYIFSDPIIPAVAAGLLKTLQIIKEADDLRTRVLENAEYLRNGLQNLGFKVLGNGTTIVPLLIGSEKMAIRFSEALFQNHILASCIRRPAVDEGKERIRFSVMATHIKTQLDTLLSICEEVGKKERLI